MAIKRMFSSRITESTRFLKMPATSQNLYFHLGINADDDGVVEAYPVMCKTGATEDDLRVLVGKGFVVILNEDLVSFVVDWREHNSLRAERKIDSIYKDLLLKILPDVSLLESKESYYSRKKAICPTNDGQKTDKERANDSIDKDSIDKDSIDKISNTISPELDKSAPAGSGILLPLINGSMYDVPLDKIAVWEKAYPAVNVHQELYQMISWLDSNPKKRKTQNGITRFINGWLERSQNRGGYRGQQAAEEKPNSLPYGKDNVFTIKPGGPMTPEELAAQGPWILPDADLYD